VKRHAHRAALALPASLELAAPLDEVISARRSVRVFAETPISFAELATLLRSAYGPASRGEQERRSCPSGGALYPLELYVAVPAGCEVAAGLYHYDPIRDVLEELATGDLWPALRDAVLYPEFLDGSPVLVAVTAMFWRTRFKYGLRGYRFALLEAGHAVQNLLLAASALGLGAVPLGGVLDCRLEALLRVDGLEESIVYAALAGRPKVPGDA
jgi:SagB-type dehydrogenase family enzyme